MFTVLLLGWLEGNPVAFGTIAKAVSRSVALALIIPVIFAVALVAVAPYRLHQKERALLTASEALVAASRDERVRLANRLEPKLEFCFWPGCCGLSPLTGYYYIGVRNPTAVTIRHTLVTISVPHKGVRHAVLQWVGAEGKRIDIDPLPSDADEHFVFGHVVNVKSGNPKLFVDFGNPGVSFDVGAFEISLSVTGLNITPTVVNAIIELFSDGRVEVIPLPGPGWALSS